MNAPKGKAPAPTKTQGAHGEVLSIRKENINLAQRTIYIPQAKAGAREQPITDNVVQFLERYLVESVPKASEWLFPSALSKSGHTVAIQKPFRQAAIDAGLVS